MQYMEAHSVCGIYNKYLHTLLSHTAVEVPTLIVKRTTDRGGTTANTLLKRQRGGLKQTFG